MGKKQELAFMVRTGLVHGADMDQLTILAKYQEGNTGGIGCGGVQYMFTRMIHGL